MAETFECQCEAVGCLGLITGAARLPVQVLESHLLSRTIRGQFECREAHRARTGEVQWT